MADALYAQQAIWAVNGNVWGTVAGAIPQAADQAKVRAMAKSPDVTAEIDAEYQEAISAGLNQTPTL